jgi:hypothetical protein
MTDILAPLYQQGHAEIDLVNLHQAILGDPGQFLDCTFGIQVNWDGRIWLCINGVTWLRFKPAVPLPPQQEHDHNHNENQEDESSTDVHTVRE